MMENNNMKKILIVRLSAIGDVIHSLPVAHALRQAHPNSQIDWLVEEQAAPLVKLNPYLDNVIILPRKKWKELIKRDVVKGIKSVFSFFKKLRGENYDISLDLQGLFKSAINSFLAKPDLRVGPADGRELSSFIYQAKVEIPAQKVHRIKKYLHFASAINAESGQVNYGLKITPVIKSRVSRLFARNKVEADKKIVIINPFTNWESKNWFLERYFKLANKLMELDYYVIFTGSKSDKKAISDFKTKTKNYSNLAGQTDLQELAEVYNRSDLYIGGDTGPTHLAAAVQTPIISLMGPTDPDTNGPYGKGHTVIQDNSLSCIRCWDRHCSRKMQCMKSISVEQVVRIAKKKLNE